MRLADFDYPLPAERIAQAPLPDRDGARLLHLPSGDPLAHRQVRELPELLAPGTVLVVNDTQVIPARLRGQKESGGRVEVLLWRPRPDGQGRATWSCLYGSAKPPRPGTVLRLGQGLEGQDAPLTARVVGRDPDEPDQVLVTFDASPEQVLAAGQVPLPPYVERPTGPTADDLARYQTVYARHPGAVAAPTAGLHLTDELLARLQARGVELCRVTLHVGPGTFRPVRADPVEDHVMHREPYVIPAATAEVLREARAAGRPVCAVGTTALRALEAAAAASPDGAVGAGAGETALFVTPGYRFRVVDRLLTNFHLPRSTLLMLVAAFSGTDRILQAYAAAVDAGYRFFSYGDATLLDRAS
jgi:S-adenosylmethionine:tRNA ribosyltransferase-isomerase